MDEALDLEQRRLVKAIEIEKEAISFTKDRFICPYCYDELLFINSKSSTVLKSENHQCSHFRHSRAQKDNINRKTCEKYFEGNNNKNSAISLEEKENLKKYNILKMYGRKVEVMLKFAEDKIQFFLLLPKFDLQEIKQYWTYKYSIKTIRCDFEQEVSVKNFTSKSNKYLPLDVSNMGDINILFYSDKFSTTKEFCTQTITNPFKRGTLFKEQNSDIVNEHCISEYKMLSSGTKIYANTNYMIICDDTTILSIKSARDVTIKETYAMPNLRTSAVFFCFEKYSENIASFFNREFGIVVCEKRQGYEVVWPPAIKNGEDIYMDAKKFFMVSTYNPEKDFLLNSQSLIEPCGNAYLNMVEQSDFNFHNLLKDKTIIVGRLGDGDNRLFIKNVKMLTDGQTLIAEKIEIDKSELEIKKEDLNYAGYVLHDEKLRFFNYKEVLSFDLNKAKIIKLYKGNYLYKQFVFKEQEASSTLKLIEILKNNKIMVRMPQQYENYKTTDKDLRKYIEGCRKSRKINKIVLDYLRRKELC